MSGWNKIKLKVIVTLVSAVGLAAAFWYGGSAPGLQGWQVTNGDPVPAADAAPQDISQIHF